MANLIIGQKPAYWACFQQSDFSAYNIIPLLWPSYFSNLIYQNEPVLQPMDFQQQYPEANFTKYVEPVTNLIHPGAE